MQALPPFMAICASQTTQKMDEMIFIYLFCISVAA